MGEIIVMKSVTYISTSQIAGDETATKAEISHLLNVARLHNSKAAISGILLFTAQSFLQVLEGPAAEIASLFERIQRDKRHSNVLVLDYRSIHERAFPDWAMAYVKLDQSPQFLTKAQNKTAEHDKLIADLQQLVLRNES